MINYNIIQKSIDYFESKGFKRIEAPWLVTEAIDSITKPEKSDPYVVSSKNKNLIASGEQGFLYSRRQKTQSPLGAGMNGGKITHTLYMMSHLEGKI